MRALAVLGLCLAVLPGCQPHMSYGEVTQPGSQKSIATSDATVTRAPTNASTITLSQADITDRPYVNLGDLYVTVAKLTLFHPDPTPALIDEKLREEAAKLGADAVVLVRYGTVGVSLVSWGQLDGRGRAISYVR